MEMHHESMLDSLYVVYWECDPSENVFLGAVKFKFSVCEMSLGLVLFYWES